MTPHRSNNRGSLVLKRKFRGVSPIRRATGSSDPTVVAELDVMLRALYSQGRVDVLEAIARGRLHPLTVYAEWRKGAALPAPEVMPPLLETWLAWEIAVPGDEHRSSIGTTRRALGFTEQAALAELPDLLAVYTQRARSKVRSVNLARAHCRAFLRDTVGVSHPLYRRVQDMRPLPRKPRERGTPHPIAFVLEVVEKLNGMLPGAGDMAWTMAATGMGNKEYWRNGFALLADRVHVAGQKRKGRERDVPLWGGRPLVEPVCWEGRFRDLLREASGGRIAIYDLRRSFARWCEEAAIIATNVDAYLGHGPKTMKALYTFGELPGQLRADAATLEAYLRRQLERAEAVA